MFIALGEAGIKVWILTGDKKETALNISLSCGHLRPEMALIDITGLESAQIAQNTLKHKLENLDTKKPLCLIVDGASIASIFSPVNKAETVPLLKELSQKCASVICCRMSPLQKSEIVSLIKNSPEAPVVSFICFLVKFCLLTQFLILSDCCCW